LQELAFGLADTPKSRENVQQSSDYKYPTGPTVAASGPHHAATAPPSAVADLFPLIWLFVWQQEKAGLQSSGLSDFDLLALVRGQRERSGDVRRVFLSPAVGSADMRALGSTGSLFTVIFSN